MDANQNTPKLVLIRGLPGSGKTTMARKMIGFVHIEADQYFIDQAGEYRYDRMQLPSAHRWCQRKTYTALKQGKPVVVSNTFVKLWEMAPYFEMCQSLGISPVVLEAAGQWGSVHDVPLIVIEKMRASWESYAND